MPSLQVRELPQAIYKKLKKEADNEHRTLAQQAIVTLAKGLEISDDPISRRKKVLDKIQQKPNKYSNLDDPVELIREDREK